MKVKKIKRSSVILGIVLGAVLGVYVLSLFWMLGWGLITSLKDDIYFLRHVIGLPDKWMWSNYIRAFNSFLVNVTTSSGIRTVYLEEMFLNSVLYALGCAIASTTCACVMAYLSARFAYKFSKVTYTVVVVAMIVPIVGSLPSEIQMVTSLGLFGTFWGVWLLKANFLGMYFLVFYAVFKGVPKDFSEAAKIDGAGNFTSWCVSCFRSWRARISRFYCSISSRSGTIIRYRSSIYARGRRSHTGCSCSIWRAAARSTLRL